MLTAAQRLAGFERRELSLGSAGSPKLRYLARGEGAPVLLVHGLGGSALNWAAVAPPLAVRHRVLVPDLPGHGDSDAIPGLSSLEPFADALAAVVEREQAAPVPVIGHSLGGLVAIRLAVRHPELISGLMLCAAAGISSTRRYARYVLEVLAVLRPGRRLASRRDRIAESPRLRLAAFSWWGAADPAALAPDVVDGFLAGWERHTDTRSAARAMVVDDVRDDLPRVAQPRLVLWGARDNQVGVADAFEYARRLDAPLRMIPDCGHLLIGERPDAVLLAFEELLERVARPRRFPSAAQTDARA
jgi:pimeloyl-ACP methyl ester carboxylesterase